MSEIQWQCKKFELLNPFELYQLLRLRSDVFVVEQNCVFLDPDNYDQQCYHLMGYILNDLVAYTRIVPAGLIYKEASIGRVVTAKAVRRTGAGKELMQTSIETLFHLFGEQRIKIGAQLYLKHFYESFSFIQTSDVYMEDGIEHIYMLREVLS
jgi:ElaA protein